MFSNHSSHLLRNVRYTCILWITNIYKPQVNVYVNNLTMARCADFFIYIFERWLKKCVQFYVIKHYLRYYLYIEHINSTTELNQTTWQKRLCVQSRFHRITIMFYKNPTYIYEVVSLSVFICVYFLTDL